MFPIRCLSIPFLVFLTASPLYPKDPKIPFEQHPPTDADIELALQTGATLEPEKIGLRFRAASDNIGAPIQMDGADERLGSFIHSSGTRNQTTGFVVEVFTPVSWIQRQAALQAKDGKTLTEDDVTEEMRKPVLRILCHPNTPVSEQQGVLGVEVERVTLRSTGKKDRRVLEPARTERLAKPVRVGTAVVSTFGSLLAFFLLAEAIELASLDKKGEFYIDIVSAEGEEKDFKVKTKHFSKLP